MFKLEFSPRIVCFVHQGYLFPNPQQINIILLLGSDLMNALAVSDSNSGKISIFDANGGNQPVRVLDSLHQCPIIFMQVSISLHLPKYP